MLVSGNRHCTSIYRPFLAKKFFQALRSLAGYDSLGEAEFLGLFEDEKLGESEFLGLEADGRLTGLRPPEEELLLLPWMRFSSGIPDRPKGPWVGEVGYMHGHMHGHMSTSVRLSKSTRV